MIPDNGVCSWLSAAERSLDRIVRGRFGLCLEFANPLADDDLRHVGDDLPRDLVQAIRRQIDHSARDPLDVIFGQLEGCSGNNHFRRFRFFRAVPRPAKCRPWTARP